MSSVTGGQLTVVLFVRNEERRIGLALRNFSSLFPVLVVDNGSADRSVELARQAGATVLELRNPGFVECDEVMTPVQQAIKTDFMFMAFAGEHYPRAQLERVAEMVASGSYDIIRLRRLSITAGSPIPISSSMEWPFGGELRVFRRGSIDFSGNKVHGKGKAVVPVERIADLGLDPSLAILQFRDHDAAHTERQNSGYNDVWAKQRFADGERYGVVRSLVRPLIYFTSTWLRHGAWRWGIAGFHQAAMRGIMEFQVHLRLWEMEHNNLQAAVIARNLAQRERLLGSSSSEPLPDLEQLRIASEFPTWALFALSAAILLQGMIGQVFPRPCGVVDYVTIGLVCFAVVGSWVARRRNRRPGDHLGWRWMVSLTLTIGVILGAMITSQATAAVGSGSFHDFMLGGFALVLPVVMLPLLRRQPPRVFAVLAAVVEVAGFVVAIRLMMDRHFGDGASSAIEPMSCVPLTIAAACLAMMGMVRSGAGHAWDRKAAWLFHGMVFIACLAASLVQPVLYSLIGLLLVFSLGTVAQQRGSGSCLPLILRTALVGGFLVGAVVLRGAHGATSPPPGSGEEILHGFSAIFSQPWGALFFGQGVTSDDNYRSLVAHGLTRIGLIGCVGLVTAYLLILWPSRKTSPRRGPFAMALGIAALIAMFMPIDGDLTLALLGAVGLAFLASTGDRCGMTSPDQNSNMAPQQNS